jgi:phosphonate transport system ATP-binding protein
MSILQPLSRECPVIGAFHQPAVVARYCSRVIGIRGGKVVYDGLPNLSAGQLETIYGDANGESWISGNTEGGQPMMFGADMQSGLQRRVQGVRV